MELILRKITKIGNQYISKYKMPDDSVEDVWITEKEYKALAEKGTSEPPHKPHPKAVWIHSIETPLFDNTSGFQEIGDMWEKEKGLFKILLGKGRRNFVYLYANRVSITGESPDITVSGVSKTSDNGRAVTISEGVLTVEDLKWQ